MKSILEALYRGGIRPDIGDYEPDSSFSKAIKAQNESLTKFICMLDETQKKAFGNFSEVKAEAENVSRFDMFSYGFVLGASLMMEILTGKEEILK